MPNNLKIHRLHRFFFWLYVTFSVLAVLSIIVLYFIDEADSAMGVGTAMCALLALIHYLLARGAANASAASKLGSGVIAVLLLFGFPIGTLLGAYMLLNLRGWPTSSL